MRNVRYRCIDIHTEPAKHSTNDRTVEREKRQTDFYTVSNNIWNVPECTISNYYITNVTDQYTPKSNLTKLINIEIIAIVIVIVIVRVIVIRIVIVIVIVVAIVIVIVIVVIIIITTIKTTKINNNKTKRESPKRT